ncbi:MAG: hypothetical protein QNJ18_04730 [Xenococcaceae cyanobacterium MO_167.B52]|nr:hypothetical protein [Xenococcaceae cyanobacterium MO_167.B52]
MTKIIDKTSKQDSRKNLQISMAVRDKFFLLLLLSLALIFDTASRQTNLKLLDEESVPEIPAARERKILMQRWKLE